MLNVICLAQLIQSQSGGEQQCFGFRQGLLPTDGDSGQWRWNPMLSRAQPVLALMEVRMYSLQRFSINLAFQLPGAF